MKDNKGKIKKPSTPEPGKPIEIDKTKMKNFAVDYFESARAVTISPNYFFEGMPREGGLVGPSIFLAISAGLGAVLQIIVTREVVWSLAAFLVTLFIFVAMARGIEYLLKQFGGKGNFEETYRVMCYSSPPCIFIGVQFLAPFALVWMSVLWFIGLKKVHDIQL